MQIVIFSVFRLSKKGVRNERVRNVCSLNCQSSCLVKRKTLNQFKRFGLEVEAFPQGLLCLWH